MPCEHPTFESSVTVRCVPHAETTGYQVLVRARCQECHLPLLFSLPPLIVGGLVPVAGQSADRQEAVLVASLAVPVEAAAATRWQPATVLERLQEDRLGSTGTAP